MATAKKPTPKPPTAKLPPPGSGGGTPIPPHAAPKPPATPPAPPPPSASDAALQALADAQKAAAAQAAADKEQQQHDAITILTNIFSSYGLESLVPAITSYIQQGVSADAVSILLQQTPEYKQRFAANDVRIKNGLSALSPAEYLATERSYRQIMSAAGLPTGFYDQTNDFTNLIGQDVSPTELQQRVTDATDAINKAPASTLSYFNQWYSTGDLVAYALDPTRAAPLIEKNLKAAEAAGLGQSQGVSLSQQQAESIGNRGMSLDQMNQGLGFVGSELPTTTKLDQIYGGTESQDDLLSEVFDNNQQAAKKRQALASQERAAFAGSSGTNTASLATENKV